MSQLGRKHSPMKLKLVAALSLVTLFGCSGAPILPKHGLPHAPSSGFTVQGVVKASIESATVVASPNQILEFDLNLILVVPLDQAATIPTEALKIHLTSDPTHENRFAITPESPTATHVAYWNASAPPVAENFRVSRGGVAATRFSVSANGSNASVRAIFPKGSAEDLTVTLASEGSLRLVSIVSMAEADLVKVLTIPSEALSDLPHVKDATITFKVTDEKGEPVPGLSKDFFQLSLYETPSDTDTWYEGHITPIEAFEDLGGGRYRITNMIHGQETGSLRFRVDVVNPPATAEASFYRR